MGERVKLLCLGFGWHLVLFSKFCPISMAIICILFAGWPDEFCQQQTPLSPSPTPLGWAFTEVASFLRNKEQGIRTKEKGTLPVIDTIFLCIAGHFSLLFLVGFSFSFSFFFNFYETVLLGSAGSPPLSHM